METRKIILQELEDISPVVAGISNRNVYSVPAGYFEGLPVQMMLGVALHEKAGTEMELGISRENVYEVPAGYFQQLAGNILGRIRAEEADNAKEELGHLSPLLDSLKHKNTFSAPDDYFAEFSGNIVAGIKAVDFVNDELETLPTVLHGLRDKQVYEIPENYFQQLPEAILRKATGHTTAKVVSMGVFRKTIRYAAAAVVAGLLIFSGYRVMQNGNKAATDQIAPQLANLTADDLQHFLDSNSAQITDVDSTVLTTGDISDKDSKDLLADISDEELQQYVDQRSDTPIYN